MRCLTPFTVKNPKFAVRPWEQSHIEVPCGKCPACRRRRASGWMFRLLQEERVSVSSYFVTLTYHTDFVPISDNGWLTLCPSHLQDFWKRLRYYCRNKIRYYACGEYGELNQRPHYHAIVFNCDEKAFCDSWTFGNVDIGTVTEASLSYVTGYMDKPDVVDSSNEYDDRVKSFSRMSRFLGATYMSDAILAYYKADLSRLYCRLSGGVRVPMPRYYRERIFTEEELKVIRHYFFWSEKWKEDVRPTYDQVKHMYDRYRAKHLLYEKRRL